MNISIVGTGYVGLVTGTCFSELGANVVCMDTDEVKISKLKKGIIPIYEPGLTELVERNYPGRLRFTSLISDAVAHGDIIFISVDTPTLADNTSDLTNIYNAVRDIALCMTGYKVIVNKSTSPVGTGQSIKREIQSILKMQGKPFDFDMVSNPEFLREGNAVVDFMCPDRIVIGAESIKALEIIEELYARQAALGIPLVSTDIETAEMVKYASNAFLAAKISLMNEIANLCELCGSDAGIVSEAVGLDKRIGRHFLNPGPGFGGSCFPKDLRAMLGIAKDNGYTPKIIKSIIDVNEEQKVLMFRKIKKTVGRLKGKTVTVLGLSFKPGTDDIRESPSIAIIRKLLDGGAKVKVYDPQAMKNTQSQNPDLNVQYCQNTFSASIKTDCIVLATEWDQFVCLDFDHLKKLVRTPVFVDLRNVYNSDDVKKYGFSYTGVGRS
ncbi:UDPglucose 6-dehydrogenase [Anaerobacterium chartisolvens]|uniref:UDP-glucose 6-dehydrogenase n=1 Tax=Anaerobacterium chartisolvens TaxID=1297424 RepID=A0A369ATW5_9FIRM|nr:UDP-glucose/GDP-mannose dehydrogenase family protein [Anaerobacterium chartisolvens]RCX12525.1 UDPglucose 6-dehydrogenase [Anaerobacterium chartisolvens]